MKPVLYYSGILMIVDGVLHLLFPDRWDALLLTTTRKALPNVGQRIEQAYASVPPEQRRAEGFVWIALGALLLWFGGSAEQME